MGNTVQNGVDTVQLSTARQSRGNDGQAVYESDVLARRVWDDAQGKWLPVEYIPFVFDCAVTANKAIGAHAQAAAVVPAGSIILDGLLDIVTAFTSGGSATVAIKVEGTADILAATAVASLGVGLMDIVPAGAAANAVKATVDRQVTVTVATAALTAGKLYGYLRVLRSKTT